jgi:hypothetical protein
MVGLDELSVAGDDEREQHRGDMLGYARLLAGLMTVSPPRFIAIGGLSGTGKTTVARALAPYILPLRQRAAGASGSCARTPRARTSGRCSGPAPGGGGQSTVGGIA